MVCCFSEKNWRYGFKPTEEMLSNFQLRDDLQTEFNRSIVKTATNENGDSQNGDKPKRQMVKTATNSQNGDKQKRRQPLPTKVFQAQAWTWT